jgi:hypothetical protein
VERNAPLTTTTKPRRAVITFRVLASVESHAPFLRSALQTGAECLKLALAWNTVSLPDIGHAVFVTNSPNEDLGYTNLETAVQVCWHTQTCADNGHYQFVSMYGPIPFSIRDSFCHHHEEDYGFLEIYVCRCLPSNKLYIIRSLLHSFQTSTCIAGTNDRCFGKSGCAEDTKKEASNIARWSDDTGNSFSSTTVLSFPVLLKFKELVSSLNINHHTKHGLKFYFLCRLKWSLTPTRFWTDSLIRSFSLSFTHTYTPYKKQSILSTPQFHTNKKTVKLSLWLTN